MSADHLKETLKNRQSEELALEKLFMDLTGESESQARSAFIFVSRDQEEPSTHPQD